MTSYVTQDLLEELQKLFPNKLPTTYCSPEDIGYLMGQQKVITYLLNQYRIQNPLTSTKQKD
jgi:hypothetical protein